MCLSLVFSSLVFLFYFLPFTLLLYFGVPKKWRNLILLLVSLAFYGWGEPIYITLMIFSMMVDFIHGLFVEKYINEPHKAKWFVCSSMVINLGLLIFFKYSGFVITNLNALLGTQWAAPDVTLPIGISFYTFQTMSYTIDIFRKDTHAQKNMINLGAYVTMFPQLVAGPIVRYQTVAEQLEHRDETWEKFSEGVQRFVIGLGKKVLLANNIGLLWSQISSRDWQELSMASAWLGLVAFGLQIYFDFSGYSDMAIGLGKMFGFDLLENFNYPYISQSITEFWRRWHMSLGTWFKDYVYIPLGGNRKGKWRTLFNVFVVWFLTGLWHGASWNFILWGIYFGCLITFEKLWFMNCLNRCPRWVRHVYTLFLLLIGWGLFAFEDFTQLSGYFNLLFNVNERHWIDRHTLYDLTANIGLWITLIIASTPLSKNLWQRVKTTPWGAKLTPVLVPLFIGFILIISTAYLVDSSYNPFLYFRF